MMRVCFLWHMHQPDYRDAESGLSLMPWVRLHATRGYYDMAKALLEAPEGVCVTINFAPSLLEQLQSLQEGQRDRFTALAYREVSSLSFSERRLILRHFFSISRDHGVNPRPRYLELLTKRDETSLEEAAGRFTEQELRDLVALFYLSWIGWAARDEHPRLAQLEAKGHQFTEEEKLEILSLGDAVAKTILPLYRHLLLKRRVELSATPYAHPILPLVYDTDAAKVARPDLPVPERFSFPEDAAWHVQEACRVFHRAFQVAPSGMWPAEGSLSPQVLPLFESAGVRWVASDEGVLLRSLPEGAAREEVMTRPWRAPGSSVDIVFRDRDLSDRIGFWYSKMSPEDAANDFLSQIKVVETQLSPEGPRILCVILDGENPWENYADSGRGFLSRVYQALAGRCVGLTHALSLPELKRGELASLHSGSWIEASFRIWIGGDADNRAWELLRAARLAIHEARSTKAPAQLSAALRHMYIAEGSDWFWWFGDDFGSQEKLFFDALFRGRLLAVYRALGQDAPANLSVPVEDPHRAGEIRAPFASISPRWDGLRASLDGWHGAGEVVIGYGRTAMHSGVEPLERFLFAVAEGRLCVRLHPSREVWDGFEARVCFDDGRVMSLTLGAYEVLEAQLEGPASSFFVEVRRGADLLARYPTRGSVLL